ncbi:hypothetical protein [Kitasatospora azatica]|uniref:hypothetical protein n=1 Tax=Kitasatospora azatica TaxID=58347 RepID=UPI00068F828F|nr:hypothetical protein [Kitasatospora azatica]
MEQELASLAMAGATTIVSAMATGAWEAARTGIVQLFRRRGQDPAAIEARLDDDAAEVAREEDRDAARQDLVGSWRRRLATLLREHPEAEAELRALMEALSKELPQNAQNWVQNNSAENGGQVNATQGGGTINVHQAPPGQRP